MVDISDDAARGYVLERIEERLADEVGESSWWMAERRLISFLKIGASGQLRNRTSHTRNLELN